MNINGNAQNDTLTVATPTAGAGENGITYTPGAAPDSGTIALRTLGADAPQQGYPWCP